MSRTLMILGPCSKGNWLLAMNNLPILLDLHLKIYVFCQRCLLEFYEANQPELNPILFRYAEILLTIAEEEGELNGSADRPYELINLLRKQGWVVMPVVTFGQSK